MSAIRVVVRCRPCPASEVSALTGTSPPIICDSEHHQVHIQSVVDHKFTFDYLHSNSASQEQIYNTTIPPLLDGLLDGIHATVCAYGATGSGKTYTLEGMDYVSPARAVGSPGPFQRTHSCLRTSGSDRSPEASTAGLATRSKSSSQIRSSNFMHFGRAEKLRPDFTTPPEQYGVIPRAISGLFQRIATRKKEFPSTTYVITVSFLQLYMEKVSDLLKPTTNENSLKLRYNPNGSFSVENLSHYECDSAESVLELFFRGITNKVMGSHYGNHQSSRSHCIFRIHVQSWEGPNNDCVRHSELSLVDLAGSEKSSIVSSQSDSTTKLVRESIEINRGLLSLGKVIMALSSCRKAPTKCHHIPYRDSKLTSLLQHALGGNSLTCMIACINPTVRSVEECISTLTYASHARKITNEPHIVEDPKDVLIRQLRGEIASLTEQLEHCHCHGCYCEIEPPLEATSTAIQRSASENNGKAALNVHEISQPLPFDTHVTIVVRSPLHPLWDESVRRLQGFEDDVWTTSDDEQSPPPREFLRNDVQLSTSTESSMSLSSASMTFLPMVQLRQKVVQATLRPLFRTANAIIDISVRLFKGLQILFINGPGTYEAHDLCEAKKNSWTLKNRSFFGTTTMTLHKRKHAASFSLEFALKLINNDRPLIPKAYNPPKRKIA